MLRKDFLIVFVLYVYIFGWLSWGDGWLSQRDGRLLATAALWLGSNPDISQKHKMGGISKEVANTLEPAQKIYKKNILSKDFRIFFFVDEWIPS
jgi:hypothetical protein